MMRTEKTEDMKMNFDEKLAMLYGADAVETQKKRYADAEAKFAEIYGAHENARVFSAPGRTEVGGNHTDHNRGCVLALLPLLSPLMTMLSRYAPRALR